MVIYLMPNGDRVPVPRDVVSQGAQAEQAFYDGQLARVAAESEKPAVPAESDA